jgi:hypothetical protein
VSELYIYTRSRPIVTAAAESIRAWKYRPPDVASSRSAHRARLKVSVRSSAIRRGASKSSQNQAFQPTRGAAGH